MARRAQSHSLDDNGQPLNGFLNRKRRIERDISELLGLAKGMLSDGVVNDQEAQYLGAWGQNHPDALAQWPTMLIFTRLRQILNDGRLDDKERIELHELLSSLIGGTASLLLGYDGATTLPLDIPPPAVSYGPGEVFVFTGKFAYGPRYKCEEEVAGRRSTCEADVTRRTTFLGYRYVWKRRLGTHYLWTQDPKGRRTAKQRLADPNRRGGSLGEYAVARRLGRRHRHSRPIQGKSTR